MQKIGDVANQFIQFIKGVNIELLRVDWPNGRELVGSTIVTMLLVVFFTIFFFFTDGIIKAILHQFL